MKQQKFINKQLMKCQTQSFIPTIKKLLPEFVELKINLFNNLMLALLKNSECDGVISTGKLVADPKNVKALFRMG